MSLEGVFLVYGSIADILQSWSNAGVFTYLVPFLLIFAVVYGILSTIKVFGENKGVNAIISLAIGVLAVFIPNSPVPIFFAQIFPRAGIGVAVLLVAIILVGLFFPVSEKGWFYGLAIFAVLVALIVIIGSFSAYSWFSGYWWQRYSELIIIGIIVVVVIGVIIGSSGPGKQKTGGEWVIKPWTAPGTH